ncbi:MAG: hypothetical protein H6757_02950 [Candidatus Omnitrophica bacterium]|nr:hypothetical protein [Candidatus Omnitrophota bacterium]
MKKRISAVYTWREIVLPCLGGLARRTAGKPAGGKAPRTYGAFRSTIFIN